MVKIVSPPGAASAPRASFRGNLPAAIEQALIDDVDYYSRPGQTLTIKSNGLQPCAVWDALTAIVDLMGKALSSVGFWCRRVWNALIDRISGIATRFREQAVTREQQEVNPIQAVAGLKRLVDEVIEIDESFEDLLKKTANFSESDKERCIEHWNMTLVAARTELDHMDTVLEKFGVTEQLGLGVGQTRKRLAARQRTKVTNLRTRTVAL